MLRVKPVKGEDRLPLPEYVDIVRKSSWSLLGMDVVLITDNIVVFNALKTPTIIALRIGVKTILNKLRNIIINKKSHPIIFNLRGRDIGMGEPRKLSCVGVNVSCVK